MTDLLIRKAQLEDAASITTIMRNLGWFERINAESFEATLNKITRHLALCHADNSHLVYVAEIDGIVQGYAAVHFVPYLIFDGPEGYVSELFVSESARNRVSAQNYSIRLSRKHGRGAARLGLLNSKLRELYQREFYKKHGWEEREQYVSFIRKLD